MFNQKSYKNVNKNSITQIVKLTKKFLFSWKCNGIFSIVNKSIHMNQSTYSVVSPFSNFNSWIFKNLSLSLFRSESFDSKLLWLVQKFGISCGAQLTGIRSVTFFTIIFSRFFSIFFSNFCKIEKKIIKDCVFFFGFF